MQQINPVEADLLKTKLDMLARYKGLPQFDFVQELALKLKKSFQLKDLDECIFFRSKRTTNITIFGNMAAPCLSWFDYAHHDKLVSS